MRHRRGYSLIECLVAMGLAATTFTLVATSLYGMYRSSHLVREDVDLQRQWGRFAEQFRADTHEAMSIEIAKDKPENSARTLTLALPEGHTVRYTLQPKRIERVLCEGDNVRHRETYRMPPRSTSRWSEQTERTLPMISLVVVREPATAGAASPLGRTMRIDAALGLLRSRRTRGLE